MEKNSLPNSEAPLSWSVPARNLPEHVDNPIHTDAGARAAGFEAALVAGTTVHAYLTRPVTEEWGLEWLANGSSTVEFVAPVEEGDRVDCVPAFRTDGSLEVLALVGGDQRARLVASLDTAEVVEEEQPARESLPGHTEPLVDGWVDYALRAGDDTEFYMEAGIVHPCTWTGLANGVMNRSLVENSWIHTRSQIVHYGTAPIGAKALVNAVVADRFDTSRGSRAVVDVRISVNGELVATVRHEALVSLRT